MFALIISWINVELSIFNTTADLLPIPVKLFNYIQYNVDPIDRRRIRRHDLRRHGRRGALDLVVGIDKATAGQLTALDPCNNPEMRSEPHAQ